MSPTSYTLCELASREERWLESAALGERLKKVATRDATQDSKGRNILTSQTSHSFRPAILSLLTPTILLIRRRT